MCFASIVAGDRVRPECVFSRGNWLQVVRVDAESIVANVIKLHSLRNWADQDFVGIAMSEFLRLFSRMPVSLKAKIAVADTSRAALPQPTGCRLLNLCPKPFLRVLPCAFLHITIMHDYTPQVKNSLTLELSHGS